MSVGALWEVGIITGESGPEFVQKMEGFKRYKNVIFAQRLQEKAKVWRFLLRYKLYSFEHNPINVH